MEDCLADLQCLCKKAKHYFSVADITEEVFYQILKGLPPDVYA